MKHSFNIKGLSIIFIIFWSLNLFSETKTFSSSSYEDAKKSESFIRFDMASTKLGLITTSFTGFVKRFTAHGTLETGKLLSGAKIDFAVEDLDTDSSGRNDKMWNHCLDMKNHPTIEIILNKELAINGTEETIPATIALRGTQKAVTFKAKALKTPKGIEFYISGDFSIKELGIPDPSIAIASVRDNIKVSSHFLIPQP